MSTTLSRPTFEPAARTPLGRGSISLLARTALSAIFSFEMIVVLYIYSNVFQVLLPKLPIDSTVIFFLLSIGCGSLIMLREGVYLRGLHLVMAYLPYLFWAFLSITWTLSRTMVFDNLKLLATVDLWMLILGGMIIANKRERVVRLMALIAMMALVVALVGIGIYIKYGSFKYAAWGVGRVYNEWGRGVTNGAVIILVLFLRSRFASLRQLVLGGLLGICTLFILVSSSRSALVSLAVPALLFMAINAAPPGRRGFSLSRAQILLLLMGVLAVTGLGLLITSGFQIDTVQRLMKVLDQADNTDMVLQANRFDYYMAAIEFFFQSPLIGNGVRSFSIMLRGFEMDGAEPHNIFLELLCDTGLVGFVLFLLLLLQAFRPISLNRLRADPLLLCATMLFTARFTVAMFGQDLAFQNLLFFTLALLAMRPPADEQAPDELDQEDEDETEFEDELEDQPSPAWAAGGPQRRL